MTDEDRGKLILNIIPQLEKILRERIVKNPINLSFPSSYTIPLSKKGGGEGIIPRGSEFCLSSGNIIRFFVYWKEKNIRTDWDLSCLLLNSNYMPIGQVSWTNLQEKMYNSVIHSGDITNSKNGASEFIDVNLSRLSPESTYFIPQVNVFNGEGFSEVEERFMGFMELHEEEKGLPFEPQAVVTKFNLRGDGKVALPFICTREKIKATNIFLKGDPFFNRVEKNKLTTSLLLSSINERQYLTVGELLSLQTTIDPSLPPIILEKPEDVYLTLKEK